jgi:aspartyl-tRNA(Asn)/glutamyl-tRNA(Gln) amidotransferase subunit C
MEIGKENGNEVARRMAMNETEKTSAVVIDATTVKHIARLAKLTPDEAEQIRLQQELGQIIGYFQRLERLDTEGVEPAYHPHGLENQLREDVVLPSEDRDDLPARQKDGCLVAPRTVE